MIFLRIYLAVNANSDNLSPTARHHRAYQVPTIIEYGTLRDVTLAVGNKGNADGSKAGSNDKTSA